MDHLDLHWRKVLNGRIAILTVIARYQADADRDQGDIDEAYKILKDTLLFRTDQLFHSPDHETLSTALARITTDLDISTLTHISHPLFIRVVQDVQENLQKIICPKCLYQSVCTRDIQVIAQYGECLSYFCRYLHLAYQETIAHYEKFLPVRLSIQPTVDFSTLPVTSPPDDIPFAKHVSGKTEFPLSSHYSSDIQLLLHVRKFDLESYYAVPYILFHEMICHAFQGLRTARTNDARRTRETDAFSEGWMDWVTYRIFDEVSRGFGWSDVEMDFDPHARDIVSEYRRARQGQHGEVPSKKTRAFFIIGEEAAQEYYAFLNSECSSSDEAEELFYGISFGWNLEGKCRERERFVDGTRNILKYWKNDKNIAALKQGLDSYRKSMKIKDLVKYLPENLFF